MSTLHSNTVEATTISSGVPGVPVNFTGTAPPTFNGVAIGTAGTALSITREDISLAAGATIVNFSVVSYVPGTDVIFVYANGIKLRKNVDYTETNSTRITLAAPYASTAIIEVDVLVPASTSGTSVGATDITLRADLASPDAGKGSGLVYGVNRVVNTISDLRALTHLGSTTVLVLGYYSAGDGGGGIYRYDSTDTSSTDNGGTIIMSVDNSRWKLVYREDVSIRQFGCNPSQTGSVNSTALAAAIAWAAPIGHTLHASEGTYNFSSALTVDASSHPYGVRIKGVGASAVKFNYSTLASGTSFLKITGWSGILVNGSIEGISFEGNSATVAVELQGSCSQHLRRCNIGPNAVGILFHNYATGQFTEYCTADETQFQPTCLTAIEYRKTSGNQSFHGSGLKNRCQINTPSTGTPVVIKVGADCLVYNAPLDAQVWVNATSTLIQNNNTGTPAVNNCNWHGTLTIEPFSATLTLATGYTRTYFTGTINSIAEYVSYGVFKHCDSVIVNHDGNVRALPKSANKNSITLGTGSTTIDLGWWAGFPNPLGGMSTSTLAYVYIVGSNYYYGFILSLTHNPFGGNGAANILATPFSFNTAGYGAPTFILNSSDQLVITNAGYPTSGVTCNISLVPIGWGQP